MVLQCLPTESNVEEHKRPVYALGTQRIQLKAQSSLSCPVRVCIRKLKGLLWKPGDNLQGEEGKDGSSLPSGDGEAEIILPFLASLLYYSGDNPPQCESSTHRTMLSQLGWEFLTQADGQLAITLPFVKYRADSQSFLNISNEKIIIL